MELFQEREIAYKTTLLKEGEISNYMYFVKKGCLRLWFNNEGNDITFQFFFEHQAVSSFEKRANLITFRVNLFFLDTSEKLSNFVSHVTH